MVRELGWHPASAPEPTNDVERSESSQTFIERRPIFATAAYTLDYKQ